MSVTMLYNNTMGDRLSQYPYEEIKAELVARYGDPEELASLEDFPDYEGAKNWIDGMVQSCMEDENHHGMTELDACDDILLGRGNSIFSGLCGVPQLFVSTAALRRFSRTFENNRVCTYCPSEGDPVTLPLFEIDDTDFIAGRLTFYLNYFDGIINYPYAHYLIRDQAFRARCSLIRSLLLEAYPVGDSPGENLIQVIKKLGLAQDDLSCPDVVANDVYAGLLDIIDRVPVSDHEGNMDFRGRAEMLYTVGELASCGGFSDMVDRPVAARRWLQSYDGFTRDCTDPFVQADLLRKLMGIIPERRGYGIIARGHPDVGLRRYLELSQIDDFPIADHHTRDYSRGINEESFRVLAARFVSEFDFDGFDRLIARYGIMEEEDMDIIHVWGGSNPDMQRMLLITIFHCLARDIDPSQLNDSSMDFLARILLTELGRRRINGDLVVSNARLQHRSIS